MSATDLSRHDLDILHRLAERAAAIAEHPDNVERRNAWYALDGGSDRRPIVIAEFEGVQRDKPSPLPDSDLECEDDWARRYERQLRANIYRFEVLRDDHVFEPYIQLGWRISKSNYGVEPVQHYGDNEGHLGSRRWDAPIADLDADFHKLKPRTFGVDREGTLAEKARLESVFGGRLGVRIRGNPFWTMGMTHTAIDLIGLENLMLAMYDNPEGLHRLMAFLRDDRLAFSEWLVREGLYNLNNENDYIGSGSFGYTRDLPVVDRDEGDPVRERDLWVLLESQETVGVGPEQFDEFVFQYQEEIGRRFGKVYYGCCEPVHLRWDAIKRLPNVARVSVSPWCDQEAMAEACGDQVVFSRKPNPTLVSTERFDEDAIRQDIRATVDAAKGCR